MSNVKIGAQGVSRVPKEVLQIETDMEAYLLGTKKVTSP